MARDFITRCLHINNRALPEKNYGYYLAQGNRASKAGVLLGTLTGGVIISIIGIAYGFWFVAICYTMSGFYVRYVRKTSADKGGL